MRFIISCDALQAAFECKTCPNTAASVCVAITVLVVLYLIGVALGNKGSAVQEEWSDEVQRVSCSSSSSLWNKRV